MSVFVRRMELLLCVLCLLVGGCGMEGVKPAEPEREHTQHREPTTQDGPNSSDGGVEVLLPEKVVSKEDVKREEEPRVICQVGETKPCYDEARGGCRLDQISGKYVCKGPCRTGVRQCVEGAWSERCLGAVEPTVERCDVVDNDCDGRIDEGTSKCVITIAGMGGAPSGEADGPLEKAGLTNPTDIVLRKSGALFIVDDEGVRKLTSDGMLTTVATSSSLDRTGGKETAAPLGVAFDVNDHLWVLSEQGIDKMDTKGGWSRFLTSASRRFTRLGTRTGRLTITPTGNVYVVRELYLHLATPKGFGERLTYFRHHTSIASNTDENVYVINPYEGGLGRYDVQTKELKYIPTGLKSETQQVALDQHGNIYVAGVNEFVKISANGEKTLLTFSKETCRSNDCLRDGPLHQAQIGRQIGGMLVDQKGNIYFSDTRNHRIRMLTP